MMVMRTISKTVWTLPVWTLSVWILDPVCLDPVCLDAVCLIPALCSRRISRCGKLIFGAFGPGQSGPGQYSGPGQSGLYLVCLLSLFNEPLHSKKRTTRKNH